LGICRATAALACPQRRCGKVAPDHCTDLSCARHHGEKEVAPYGLLFPLHEIARFTKHPLDFSHTSTQEELLTSMCA